MVSTGDLTYTHDFKGDPPGNPDVNELQDQLDRVANKVNELIDDLNQFSATDDQLARTHVRLHHLHPEVREFLRDYAITIDNPFPWQVQVLEADVTTPPVSPSDGDRYIVGAGATGDWAGQDGKIAEWYDGQSTWTFRTPDAGWIVWDLNTGGLLTWGGAGWGGFAVTSWNGRTGDVVPLAGDYTGAQVTQPADWVGTSGNVGDQLAEHDLSMELQKNCGRASWAGGPTYYSIAGSDFTLQATVGGFVRGRAVTASSGQTVTLGGANTCTLICYDETGTLTAIDSAAITNSTYRDYVFLFEVLTFADGSTRVTVREDHPYDVPTGASMQFEKMVGTIIGGDGGNVAAPSPAATGHVALSGSATIYDHGLETELADSGGAGLTWDQVYTDGSGQWARNAQAQALAASYNSAGTPTAIPGGSYGVYRLYASKEDLNTLLPRYFAVMHTAVYTSTGLATQAIANGQIAEATYPLTGIEIAQLGYVIIDGTTSEVVQYIPDKQQIDAANSGSTTALGLLAFLDLAAETNIDSGATDAGIPLTANGSGKGKWGGNVKVAGDLAIVNSPEPTLDLKADSDGDPHLDFWEGTLNAFRLQYSGGAGNWLELYCGPSGSPLSVKALRVARDDARMEIPEGHLDVGGSSGVLIRKYDSSDTAITSLVPGSSSGALIRGPSSTHLVFRLSNPNGDDDSISFLHHDAGRIAHMTRIGTYFDNGYPVRVEDTTDSTSWDSGAVTNAGGLGLAGKLFFKNNIQINESTALSGFYNVYAGFNLDMASSGSSNVCLGDTNKINGGNRHVNIGYGNQITSWNRHELIAVGSLNICVNRNSFCFGEDNYAGGGSDDSRVSLAMGLGNNAGNSGVAIGEICIADESSLATGRRSEATGIRSVATGGYCEASGDYSMALHWEAAATFDNSIAFGRSAATTKANQIVLGNPTYCTEVYLAGALVVGAAGSTIPDLAITNDLTVGGTITGTIAIGSGFEPADVTIKDSAPFLEFWDTSDALDEKRWQIATNGGNLDYRTVDDAGSSSTVYARVSRTADTPDAWDFFLPIDFNDEIAYLNDIDVDGGDLDVRDGATDLLRVSDPGSDTETSLLIRHNDTGIYHLRRVTAGVTDSGGSGYRLLRIAN